MTLIVLFNLKDEIAKDNYEVWAKTVDVPIVKKLSCIDDFKVFKTSGILGSDAIPPYQYVEVLEVNDMEQLGKEVASDIMKQISAQFQLFADNPIFILSSQIA
jgi:hypothetical protein